MTLCENHKHANITFRCDHLLYTILPEPFLHASQLYRETTYMPYNIHGWTHSDTHHTHSYPHTHTHTHMYMWHTRKHSHTADWYFGLKYNMYTKYHRGVTYMSWALLKYTATNHKLVTPQTDRNTLKLTELAKLILCARYRVDIGIGVDLWRLLTPPVGVNRHCVFFIIGYYRAGVSNSFETHSRIVYQVGPPF